MLLLTLFTPAAFNYSSYCLERCLWHFTSYLGRNSLTIGGDLKVNFMKESKTIELNFLT